MPAYADYCICNERTFFVWTYICMYIENTALWKYINK